MELILRFKLVVALLSSLPRITRFLLPGNCMKFSLSGPFSPYSVFPRQGAYWETNVCAGRSVLPLKSVVQHHSATTFRYSQVGIKTLDDKYCGSCPIKSISARLFPDECFRVAVREFVDSERVISDVEAESLWDSGFNKLVIMFGAWIKKIIIQRNFLSGFRTVRQKHPPLPTWCANHRPLRKWSGDLLQLTLGIWNQMLEPE